MCISIHYVSLRNTAPELNLWGEKDWEEKKNLSVFLLSSPVAQTSLYFSDVPMEVNVNGFEGDNEVAI